MSTPSDIVRAQKIAFLASLENFIDEKQTTSSIYALAKLFFSTDDVENSILGLRKVITLSMEALKQMTKEYPFFTDYQKEVAGVIKGLQLLDANTKKENEKNVLFIDLIQAERIQNRLNNHPMLLIKDANSYEDVFSILLRMKNDPNPDLTEKDLQSIYYKMAQEIALKQDLKNWELPKKFLYEVSQGFLKEFILVYAPLGEDQFKYILRFLYGNDTLDSIDRQKLACVVFANKELRPLCMRFLDKFGIESDIFKANLIRDHMADLREDIDKLSSDLYDYLEEIFELNFLEEDLHQYAKYMAYEIIQIQHKSDRFCRMAKGKKKYLDLQSDSLTGVGIPFTYTLKKWEKQKIKVHIYSLSFNFDNYLGHGSHKSVKKSLTLYVDPTGGKRIRHMYSVLKRSIKDLDKSIVLDLEESLQLHVKIFDKLGKKANISSAPDFEFYTAKDGQLRLEIEQEWFNGVSSNVIDTGKLPLHPFKNHDSQKFDFLNRFQILYDVADALHLMHSKGLVHRDVKPANIFVKLEDNKIKGYLDDFDLAVEEFGDGNDKQYVEYYYYDTCSKFSWVTPSTDVYALAKTAVDLFLPGYYKIDQKYDSLNFSPITVAERFYDSIILKLKGDFNVLNISSQIKKQLQKEFEKIKIETPMRVYLQSVVALQKFVKSNSFDKEQRCGFQRIQIEIYAMMEIIQLAFEQFERSYNLFEYLRQDTYVRGELLYGDKSKKLKMLEIIGKDENLYITAKDFKKRLEAIEKTVQKALKKDV